MLADAVALEQMPTFHLVQALRLRSTDPANLARGSEPRIRIRGCLGKVRWRRRRDSNPRYPVRVRFLSRELVSATHPRLRDASRFGCEPRAIVGVIGCGKGGIGQNCVHPFHLPRMPRPSALNPQADTDSFHRVFDSLRRRAVARKRRKDSFPK